MTRWILGGLAVVTAVALVWLMTLAERDPSAEPTPDDRPASDGPVLVPALTVAAEATPPPPEVAWRVVDERAVRRLPAFEDGWSQVGRVLVDVSHASAAVWGWRVGDRLALEIPQVGEQYEPTIERVDDGPGQSRAVRASAVDADGRSRRVVLTVGPNRVFAYVDTPGGPYELIGNGQLAWLLPSASIMAGLDTSQPDTILPAPGEGDGAPR
ncbi:MAG: hypothetical protein OXG82_02960 [Gammaproteobacteria bacterium]|nr:hypothetical protein [Gammaproteobacteria bacterium]